MSPPNNGADLTLTELIQGIKRLKVSQIVSVILAIVAVISAAFTVGRLSADIPERLRLQAIIDAQKSEIAKLRGNVQSLSKQIRIIRARFGGLLDVEVRYDITNDVTKLCEGQISCTVIPSCGVEPREPVVVSSKENAALSCR